MSDRKYRQRGYQDDGRERHAAAVARQGNKPEREPGAPAGARRISSEGARNPRMMGYREVARCARCGAFVDAQIFSRSTCPKCQQELRACVQCTHFDPGARFECARPLPARVVAEGRGQRVQPCSRPRTSWERETTAAGTRRPPALASQSGAPSSSARKAFDDLFKF